MPKFVKFSDMIKLLLGYYLFYDDSDYYDDTKVITLPHDAIVTSGQRC